MTKLGGGGARIPKQCPTSFAGPEQQHQHGGKKYCQKNYIERDNFSN